MNDAVWYAVNGVLDRVDVEALVLVLGVEVELGDHKLLSGGVF